MRETLDIYGLLKQREEQDGAGKWLFHTGPQQIVDFDGLSGQFRAEPDAYHSLLSAARDVVPVRYHATKHPYARSELLADGSWANVEREAVIQRLVTTAQCSYVWPHRRDEETEDRLAREMINPALPHLIRLGRRVLWGQMTELLDGGEPVDAGGRTDSVFDDVRERMQATAGCVATHLVMNPSDGRDAGWFGGRLSVDPAGAGLDVANPSGLSLLLDSNCPRGRAVVFDASHLYLGIDEVGAQIRTYPDVSERGYELCVEMVTSVGLWWTHRGAFQEVRGIGSIDGSVAASSAAG